MGGPILPKVPWSITMSGGGDLVVVVPTSIGLGGFLVVGCFGGSFTGGSKPGGGLGMF